MHTAAASTRNDVFHMMNNLLTLGLALALSGLMTEPLLAKSKDNDHKKKSEKSSKSGKKDAQRPAVVASQRLRSPASQSRDVVQRTVATNQLKGRGTQNAAIYQENRTRQESSHSRYQDGSRNDNRYSNSNDDRGWSQYQYYRAPSSAYRGWDRSRNYSWNNHNYRWYDGSWIIINPGYDYSGYRHNTVSYSGRSEVRDVQVLLARRGYEPGPIDGDMGYRTSRAIERFQEDRGLAVTGHIDRTLLIELDRG